ncbi:MAG: fluoride efflux transporter CrcB [Rickettsiales bacterium]
MNMLSLMYVGIGGAVGSMSRFALMSLIGRYNNSTFPLGTLTVNLAGSFLLGVLIAVIALMLPNKGKDLHLLVAVGFLGGFTTFSAFSMDAYLLIEKGLHVQAMLYVFTSIVVSVLALLGGMWMVKLVA